MPFPQPTLSTLRQQAMQDVTGSGLPNANGFLRASLLRVMAWVQAGLAYLHYGYLDWIARQSTPFTATDEYLAAWAALAPTPVLREAPTYATGPVQFSGTPNTPLPAGTIVVSGNLSYQTVGNPTVQPGGLVTATVIAVVAGSAGNQPTGTPMTISNAVAGITAAGVATGPITGGNDLETDTAFRTRMLQSYAAPPHGGNQSDFRVWALQVPGVSRAWVPAVPPVPGAVTVFFMMDSQNAGFGGFPQGTNGVASLESRGVTATGDQLTVANALFALRPVPAVVFAVAPVAEPYSFVLHFSTAPTTTQQGLISAALNALFLALDSPLANTSIQQSDVSGAIAAISGLSSFTIDAPTSFPLTSAFGSLLTLGGVTYV